jgi:8-oxo-dGTP pyrophosphatase MutT (NUDIX family)
MKIERPKSRQPIPENAKCVFRGVMFDVYQWEQEMFDGTKTIFEKIKRPDTTVVFPVLPDGKILLSKQEQPGKPPFIGGCGGRIEEGEEILESAKRELLEESGYEAEEFILLDARQPASKIEWAVYTFIAKGIKKVAELSPDNGEKIELFSVTLDEFIDIPLRKDIHFAEQEIVSLLFEAKFDLEKKKELKKLFEPLENK